MPRPVFCMINSKPTPKATSASSMPQSMRRLGLLWSRMPARLADSSPGAFTVDSGGNSSHKAPYAITPMNWKVAKATKAILTAISGQPRCLASPVQTPPSQAPSATRVARGLSSGLRTRVRRLPSRAMLRPAALAQWDRRPILNRHPMRSRPVGRSRGTVNVRLEMARVRGSHDVLTLTRVLAYGQQGGPRILP